MTYEMMQLCADVRTLLARDPLPAMLAEACEDDAFQLEALTEMMIVQAAMEVEAAAPLEMLEDLVEMRPTVTWDDEEPDGLSGADCNFSGWIPLPDDFLRLASFRMSDWERPVTEPLRPDSHQALLQSSRIGALRGTPRRPQCLIRPHRIAWALHFHACASKDAHVAEALYLPLPTPSRHGTIKLSRKLLPQILQLAADRVKNSLND